MAFRYELAVALLAVSSCLACSIEAGASSEPEQARAEQGADPSGWKLEPVATHDLPAELLWARDVRGLGDSEALISAVLSGVFRWDFSLADSPSLLVPRGNGIREIWQAESVATSGRHFIAASLLFSYGWGSLDSDTPLLEKLQAIELISDIDLRDDKLVILGVQRGEDRAYAPNGDIAWLGDLEQPPEEMKPVLYSKTGPGAKGMDKCGLMVIGVARFMNDGSFVLVPGVEDGVFHFDASGQLLRTWTDAAFGFDAGCPLEKKEVYRLAVDEPGRWRWVNGRRVVDEILPLPDGKPGLVVREVVDGKVRWILKVPKARGEVDSFEIPISSPSEFAHLKGDVIDDRVYFLLWTRGLPPEGPDQPPRLVVMKITGKE